MRSPKPEDSVVRVGKVLRRLRERRGLTKVEVARRMGLKPSSSGQIARWERGSCSPRFEALWDVVEAVEASLHDFLRELVPSKADPRLQEIASELKAMANAARARR